MLLDSEKKKMLKAHSIGPKMVEYIELAGYESLAEMKDESAEEVCLRIDEALGRPHINGHPLAIQAIENLIEHALETEA